MTKKAVLFCVTAFTAMWILLWVTGNCDPVIYAQPPGDWEVVDERAELQIGLAKICASEASIRVTDDCAAIWQVLRARTSRRSSPLVTMRAYSDRVFDRARRDGRAWIAHLNPEGTEPRGWPVYSSRWMRHRRTGELAYRQAPHPPWSHARARWLRLYAHAGDVVAGRVESPCTDAVHHWGSPHLDTARFVRTYAERGILPRLVACGRTDNWYWNVSPNNGTPTEEAIARLFELTAAAQIAHRVRRRSR